MSKTMKSSMIEQPRNRNPNTTKTMKLNGPASVPAPTSVPYDTVRPAWRDFVRDFVRTSYAAYGGPPSAVTLFCVATSMGPLFKIKKVAWRGFGIALPGLPLGWFTLNLRSICAWARKIWVPVRGCSPPPFGLAKPKGRFFFL